MIYDSRNSYASLNWIIAATEQWLPLNILQFIYAAAVAFSYRPMPSS